MLVGAGCAASTGTPRNGIGADAAAHLVFVTAPRFNQHVLEYFWDPSAERASRLPRDSDPVEAPALDVDDPASVAAFVLRHAPDEPVVYPTEHYFYYEFYAGPRLISGNLRFTDAPNGLLNIGYFDRFDRAFLRAATLGSPDGLELTWDPARWSADVRFRGVRRVFRLPRPEWRPAPLLPDEDAVADVLDESGFAFRLIFHRTTAQFYYALAADAPLPEPLVRVMDNPPVDLGMRSRFVFLTEPALARRILVGVHAPSVRANNLYDGPFDQVPPDLPIQEKLEASYPYVKLRGGIDEHGNFRELEGQRVAISPYTDYDNVPALLDFVRRAYRADAGVPGCFLPLVYERKRDAHRDRPGETPPGTAISPTGGHDTATSRSWPVDHGPQFSDQWPATHAQPTSLRAPANEPLRDRVSRPDAPGIPLPPPHEPARVGSDHTNLRIRWTQGPIGPITRLSSPTAGGLDRPTRPPTDP